MFARVCALVFEVFEEFVCIGVSVRLCTCACQSVFELFVRVVNALVLLACTLARFCKRRQWWCQSSGFGTGVFRYSPCF